MAYHNSVLSQLLKLVPRLEFEKQANRCNGQRRSDALSRWSQFVALMIGQLGGRRSLRDIEATVRSQGSTVITSAISRSADQPWVERMGGWIIGFMKACSKDCISFA